MTQPTRLGSLPGGVLSARGWLKSAKGEGVRSGYVDEESSSTRRNSDEGAVRVELKSPSEPPPPRLPSSVITANFNLQPEQYIYLSAHYVCALVSVIVTLSNFCFQIELNFGIFYVNVVKTVYLLNLVFFYLVKILSLKTRHITNFFGLPCVADLESTILLQSCLV